MDKSLLILHGQEVGGGSSNVRMSLLWTNPSPSASFAAQNVDLSSTNYDFVHVMASLNNLGVNQIVSSTYRYGNSASFLTWLCYYDNGTRFVRRNCQFVNNDKSKISIGDCYDNSSVNNALCIPIAIYGIKLI